MSGHKYISNPTNLFEDEVDDDTFVNSYRSRYSPPSTPQTAPAYGGQIAELERQRQGMLERRREIEQRTLDSTSRSLGLLRESEDIGIATSEELSRQREQLQNTNRRLDEINTNLNYSQRHLNGIKSIFYGFKNYLSGKSDQTPPPRSQTSSESNIARGEPSRLQDTIDNDVPYSTREELFSSHPSTHLRGLNDTAEPMSDSRRVNELLDNNLDQMAQHISRLKGLGAALGDEIDQQNHLIDTIQDKVEGADIKIGKQNKQMNKILGK